MQAHFHGCWQFLGGKGIKEGEEKRKKKTHLTISISGDHRRSWQLYIGSYKETDKCYQQRTSLKLMLVRSLKPPVDAGLGYLFGNTSHAVGQRPA